MSLSRPEPVTDDVDRAMKYKDRVVTMNVKRLGFYHNNRGSQGVLPRHVHEVADSCREGVKDHRYLIVMAVKVPAHALASWRLENQKKCQNDSLMPAFSSEMDCALLTKTHFVHAIKLATEGSRTLYNLPNGPKVAFKNSQHVLEEGVSVQLFSEELWDDPDAMLALMTEDNKNADICMKENEIQVMGQVAELIKGVPKGTEVTEGRLLTALQKRGVNAWTTEHLKGLIFFTQTIDPKIGDQFLLCVPSTTTPILIFIIPFTNNTNNTNTTTCTVVRITCVRT